jgi:hypothetical protein
MSTQDKQEQQQQEMVQALELATVINKYCINVSEVTRLLVSVSPLLALRFKGYRISFSKI